VRGYALWGCHELAGREGDRGRCRSAVATSGSDAHQVFDEIPARNKLLNFGKFPIGEVKILDKDSKHIFVMKKYDVLQKSYFNFEVWSLFQIQTLADV
jgi:hypothetical protein